jgi:hypothetical protein
MGGGESLFSTAAGVMAVVAGALALLALVGMVVLLARQQRLMGRYEHLMAGTSGGNLEAVLHDHVAQVRETAAGVQEVRAQAQRLQQEGRLSLQHVGIVRYNPFQDTGGDQSFSVALADDYGNGLVISSLYSRGTSRVYAKPLLGWESSYSLTDEERQSIASARKAKG